MLERTLIVVDGIDGAGKTTLIEELREQMHKRGTRPVVMHWGPPGLYGGAPNLIRAMANDVLAASNRDGPTIWDRGFASVFVYSASRHGNPEEVQNVAVSLEQVARCITRLYSIHVVRDIADCTEADPAWGPDLLSYEQALFDHYFRCTGGVSLADANKFTPEQLANRFLDAIL